MNTTIPYQCGNNHSVCHPVEIEVKPGVYFFEVFGGSGGDSNYAGRFDEGGRGGFSMGFYIFSKPTKIYVYVGSKGCYSYSKGSLGGWNGGGHSTNRGASGGGGTDIRLVNGECDSTEGLQSRIIVAGGGGGSYGGTGCHSPGSSGGGEFGERLTALYDCSSPSTPPIACVGTQSNCEGGSDSEQTRGVFGCGGSNSAIYSPGGGGGYWGGGSGVQASGGGSGSIKNMSSFGNIHPLSLNNVNSGDGFAIIKLVQSLFCNTTYFSQIFPLSVALLSFILLFDISIF